MKYVTVNFDDGTTSVYMREEYEEGGYKVWMHHFDENGQLREIKPSGMIAITKHALDACGRLRVAKNIIDTFFEQPDTSNTRCIIDTSGVRFVRKDERRSLTKWWER